MEKRNSQPNGENKRLVRLRCDVRLRCGSLSITTPVSHQANEFDILSELHGQVSIRFFVVHEAMNGCKILKIHCKCKYQVIISK